MASSKSDEEAQEVARDFARLGADVQIVDDRGPMAKAADIRMHVLPEGGLFDPRRRRVEFQEVNIP